MHPNTFCRDLSLFHPVYQICDCSECIAVLLIGRRTSVQWICLDSWEELVQIDIVLDIDVVTVKNWNALILSETSTNCILHFLHDLQQGLETPARHDVQILPQSFSCCILSHCGLEELCPCSITSRIQLIYCDPNGIDVSIKMIKFS